MHLVLGVEVFLHPEGSDLVHATVGDGHRHGGFVSGVGWQLCDLPYDGLLGNGKSFIYKASKGRMAKHMVQWWSGRVMYRKISGPNPKDNINFHIHALTKVLSSN